MFSIFRIDWVLGMIYERKDIGGMGEIEEMGFRRGLRERRWSICDFRL